MGLRLRVLSLLAKIEATYGIDSIPTGAANAILLAGNPTLTPMELTSVERDILRPFFGNAETLPSSIYGKIDFDVEAAGSGAAGTAPAWGVLLRGCGFSETTLAAPLTGTAQAGGTTTSIRLAAGASAVNEFYNGMPISITGGTGNGQSGLIVDYDGTTRTATVASSAWVAPDATSQYSIGASVVYRRITNNPESLTTYMNIDGVLHRFYGVRGNVTFGLSVDSIPMFKFSMQGLFTPVVDAVSPTVVLTGWRQPQPANRLNTPFAVLHGFQGALESFNVDIGNQIAFHTLINAQEEMLLTESKPSGDISIEATTVAQRNWWLIAQNATLGAFAIQHGTVAGNRIGICMPAVQIAAPQYGDKNGVAMLNASLIPTPISGNDELTFSAF